ncbi:hypothetical protein [Sinosporangium album]|uniref:hypothetical protein n=1 Tax=Sinosporangium album TaxID=504805 RepID=UPI0015A2F2F0|nr:hypothetical protein [Sinosporangium album]
MPPAPDLPVEQAVGDLERPDTVKVALHGVRGVFLLPAALGRRWRVLRLLPTRTDVQP